MDVSHSFRVNKKWQKGGGKGRSYVGQDGFCFVLVSYKWRHGHGRVKRTHLRLKQRGKGEGESQSCLEK